MAAVRKSRTAESAGHTVDFLSLFDTELGWMGIVGSQERTRLVLVGQPGASAVRKAVKSHGFQSVQEQDWNPPLRQALQDYSCGKAVDFAEFELQLPDRTQFRDKVLAATRQLAYGETVTYGELAKRIGHPGAARAVGTVMSTNRFPIVIPCHRVLAAGRLLGGYTCPAGIDFKKRLLQMESACFVTR